MAKELRVLIVEDEKDAVTLMVRMLGQSDLTVHHHHVGTEADYRAALENAYWHVILADYALPQFGALAALRILQESGRDIPFIVVSGRIGEETAAELMRAGADDYISKVNLSRLLPAVKRAVAEARERQGRRAAEAVKLKIDQNLRHVVRENVDGMLVLSEAGAVLFANNAVEDLLGRKQVEFLGAEFGTPAVSKQTIEIQLVRRTGEMVFVDMRATAIEWEAEPAILLSLRDVTARKEAEERLRGLNRAHTVLSECNRILVRAQTEQELLDGVCRVVVEQGGYRFAWVGMLEHEGEDEDEGERVLRPAAEFGLEEGYMEELGPQWVDRPADSCPEGRAVGLGETVVIQDTGDRAALERWREAASRRGFLAMIALPLLGGEGHIGALSIYANKPQAFAPDEITLLEELADDLVYGLGALRQRQERAAAEAALRASEERFRKAVIHAPVATVIHAEDGEIIMVNKMWTDTTGYMYEDVPTMEDWFEKAYGDNADKGRAAFREMYARYKPATPDDFIVRTKTGELRNWYLSSAPLGRLPDGRRAMISMAMDFTEQRSTEVQLHETEQQLLQLQRLESVGRLAGGVAHDFNNVLHAIGGYIEFLADDFEPGSAQHDDIASVRQLVKRASSLTQQLLAFSRRQTLQPEVIDLNEEIGESLKLLRRLIGEDIEIDVRPADGLYRVYADPGQIYQVIMNLAVNARDAMPKGGRLTIETANEAVDESYTAQHVGSEPGDYAALIISDTGTGMDEETKTNLFEPFYTTKEAGKGTGLGLSTVYGIVKQHGGTIWVYSELGQGTTFKIYLPRTAKEAPEEQVAPEAAPARDMNGKTILIAEDEAPVRYVITRILRHYGFTVIVSENAREAIDAARGDDAIDLLLTDVVMPDMNGNELCAEVRKIRPGLPVLFMSGYADDRVFNDGVLAAGTPFIQKPFGAKKLLTAIHDILGNTS